MTRPLSLESHSTVQISLRCEHKQEQSFSHLLACFNICSLIVRSFFISPRGALFELGTSLEQRNSTSAREKRSLGNRFMAGGGKGYSLVTFGRKPHGNGALMLAQVLRHFQGMRMVSHDLYKLLDLSGKKLLMKLLQGAQRL